MDKKSPCSSCILVECFLSLFPILEITKPEIGIKSITKSVSLKLNNSMAAREKKIVRGSLTNSSRIDKKDC